MQTTYLSTRSPIHIELKEPKSLVLIDFYCLIFFIKF